MKMGRRAVSRLDYRVKSLNGDSAASKSKSRIRVCSKGSKPEGVGDVLHVEKVEVSVKVSCQVTTSSS